MEVWAGRMGGAEALGNESAEPIKELSYKGSWQESVAQRRALLGLF